MKRIIAFFTLLMFILSILSTTIIIAEDLDYQNLFESNNFKSLIQTKDDFELVDPLLVNNTSCVNRIGSLNQNNAHSGYWFDSFNNDSNIEWALSDHINVNNNEIKIDLSFLKPFELDNYTVGLWHFNESTGFTTYDETSNNNDGTITGATWTSGRFNATLNYSGGTNRVTVSNDASLNFGAAESFTIQAWFKTSVTQKNIIAKYVLGIPAYYQLWIPSNGKARFTIRCSNSINHRVDSNSIVTDNKWHYLVGVRDTSLDQIKLYLDGQLENSSTDITTGSISTTGTLNIGKYFGGSALNFNGKIDEIRISNKTRAPNIYKANITSKNIDLPANMYWDTLIFNESQPRNTAIDVKILNATNNQQISGTPKYINDGEFDISFIDPIKYPSIKLNASFIGNDWGLTPALNYWGVSWNDSRTWSDTFFGGVKVESFVDMNSIEGNANFQNLGTLRSKSITLPNKQYYDTLIVNKTEPVGGLIKVAVLDAQTDSIIPGFQDISNPITDISTIDPFKYPSIKLKANFTSSGLVGTIHNWSVNWTNNYKPKIVDIKSAQGVNRTSTAIMAINLTDEEEQESDLTLDVKYKLPIDVSWMTEYLGPLIYINNRWEITFTPTVDAKLGLYNFTFICNDSYLDTNTYSGQYRIEVRNNHPIINNIKIDPDEPIVNRTHTQLVIINATDIERSSDTLDISIKYKSPINKVWMSTYSKNKTFKDNKWEVKFSPLKTADLGEYILNITCNDSDSEVFEHIKLSVMNNKPTQPRVTIYPFEPYTTDDLEIHLAESSDAETDTKDIQYWYRWYRDNEFLSIYDDKTVIPNLVTTKDETWRVEVFPFDGIEVGPSVKAEVEIQNSIPELYEQFDELEMYEDIPIVLNNKLTDIFFDPDYDVLTFTVTGQDKIDVDITQLNGTLKFTPALNWYGTELITFYANDSIASAQTTVLVKVEPTNDLPKIRQIGSQIISENYPLLEYVIRQNEKLELPIVVEDIDGDVERGLIQYILNISERSNLYFSQVQHKLIFTPKNDDVGLHFINIRMTDNNETPTIYISQDIKITVLNVNDPPVVEIQDPAENKKFMANEEIFLNCSIVDIDLLIPNSGERFVFLWFKNGSELDKLGTEQSVKLAVNTLAPGFYNISVKVRDSGGEVAYDFVNIEVEEIIEIEIPETGSEINYLFWGALLIIIVVIIIVSILAFLIMRKKKREEVLQPDASYIPPSVTPGTLSHIPEPQELLQPQTIPSGGTFAGPAVASQLGAPGPTGQVSQLPSTAPTEPYPQLPTPQVQPTPQPQPQPQPQAMAETEPELDYQAKIKLLEQRLLQGEISEETYLNLKDKMEYEASLTGPAPQLPPAIAQTPALAIQEPPISTEPPTPEVEPPPTEIIEPSVETPMISETPPVSQEPQMPTDLPTEAYEQPPPPSPQQQVQPHFEPLPQTQPHVQTQVQPQIPQQQQPPMQQPPPQQQVQPQGQPQPQDPQQPIVQQPQIQQQPQVQQPQQPTQEQPEQQEAQSSDQEHTPSKQQPKPENEK